MRLTRFLLAVVLAMVIGGVIGAQVEIDRSENGQPGSIPAPAAQIAVDFYDSINEVLETGRTDSLERMLAPEFVDRTGLDPDGQTGDEFVAYVLAIRDIFPDYRVECVNVEAHGSELMAHVVPIGGEVGAFFDIEVEAGALWAGPELLKMQGGHIAERVWSAGAPLRYYPVLSHEFGVLDPGVTGPHAWSIELYQYARRARIEPAHPSILVIMSEEIDVKVESIATGEVTVWPLDGHGVAKQLDIEESVAGTRGDVVLIPEGAVLRVAYEGDTIARSVLLSSEEVFGSGNGPTCEVIISPCEVVKGEVGVALPIEAEGSELTLNVGLVRLDRGGIMPAHDVSGVEFALVDEGVFTAVPHDGSFIQWTGSLSRATKDVEEISAGQGVQVFHGNRVSYEAVGTGAATLWLISYSVSGS